MKKIFIMIIMEVILFCAIILLSIFSTDDIQVKNLIIIIGDGMGKNQIEVTEKIGNKKLAFTEWLRCDVNTDSIDFFGKYTTTDSAASATALATGQQTINGYVGKNNYGNNLETVMDVAKRAGKSTGIVTTDFIYGATPASFSGHAENRADFETIVDSQIKSNVDLFCGNANKLCLSKKENYEEYGYSFFDNFDLASESLEVDKAYWQFDLYGKDASIKLNEVAGMALEFLEDDEQGFVLMIEQSNIDTYGHANELDGIIQCVNYLNQTVETVMNWVGDRNDTVVVVTADHETGGLSYGSENEYELKTVTQNNETLSYAFTTPGHTSSYVNFYVYGIEPDFSKFKTFKDDSLIKNKDIGKYFKELVI